MRPFGTKKYRNPVELLPIFLAGLTGAGAAAGSILATRALTTADNHITLSNPQITFMPEAKVVLGGIAALAGVVLAHKAVEAHQVRSFLKSNDVTCLCAVQPKDCNCSHG